MVTGDPSNVAWAEEVGVSEASIRRHLSHGETENSEQNSESADFDSNGVLKKAVTFSEKAWGYEDYRNFIRSTGQDPDQVTFTWGWTSKPEGGFWNKLNNVRPVVESADHAPLATFYAEVEKAQPPTECLEPSGELAMVVVLADWQLGKTGRRGGTKETLERLKATRDKVLDLAGVYEPQKIVLLDAGDGIEGFESGGDPQFTNDLSLPDQLDAYATEMFKFVSLAAGLAETTVAVVPSNHAAWRRGKQSLGKPTDDFGLYVHKQVQKVCDAANYDVQWLYPADYDESVVVDVYGVPVGMVHGNQFGPGKAIDWWQAQAFGSQAVTKADVLVSGHYHSFGAGVAGINPFTDRERYWLGAPTVDPGSDWYRAIRGRDSLPGTLTFNITPEGFDLGSLSII